MRREQRSPLTRSEAKVRDLLRKHTSYENIYRGGWPDFVVWSAPPVAIEVKWRMDNLSQTQLKTAKLLLAGGMRYYIVRVLDDGNFDIVELGGGGRVTEEEFVRAIVGISGTHLAGRGEATRARVRAVLEKYAKDQTAMPELRKSRRDLADESGVSLETFNRHRQAIERASLLGARYGVKPSRILHEKKQSGKKLSLQLHPETVSVALVDGHEAADGE